jgi:hypothetical protein
MQVLRTPETSVTILKWTQRNIEKLSASSVTDIIYLFIFSGTTGQHGSPHPRGVLITHDAPQSVGLLWTSGQLVAETST